MTEPQQPQPQPQPYPHPGYQQQYTPLPPVNTYAILAAIFAFVVFPPLGIYFGRKAKEQIAVSGERGTELATVGVVAGWIISVLYGLFLIVWCGFVGLAVLGGFHTSP
ncbi:DUF4190 domain-containing protein [Dactylosporangium sp. CA-052675]|uniref:DUF4190 domain-containing protein n=1 Tax=Dactylosporangium sp. CA-052675 TaxID=3239927 RepID=UPI003D94421B